MARDKHPSCRVKDNENENENVETKKKTVAKDASPARGSESTDTSGLRRSARETPLSKHTKECLSNTRKSERIEKRTPPSSPPIKMKADRIQKQMTPSPLKRSDRGKKHTSSGSPGSEKSAEESASTDTKSKKEKVGKSLAQRVVDVSKDSSRHGIQDPDVGSRKKKRMSAHVYKALFKPQRIIAEADDDNDTQKQGKSCQANTSSHRDEDQELKRLDKLPRLDNAENGSSGSKLVEDKDDDDDECSDGAGEEPFLEASKKPCTPSDSGLRNNVEVDEQPEVGESSPKQKFSFAEGHKTSLNGRRVEVAPHAVAREPEVDISMSLEQAEHFGRDDTIGDQGASSKRKASTGKVGSDACANNKDSPISHRSPSGCKRHDCDKTCSACLKMQRIPNGSKKQQELDHLDTTCDRDLSGTSHSKDRGTHEAAGLTEIAENDDANVMLSKETDICVACKLGGNLRYCGAVGCHRCYHLSCLDPPLDNVPLGIWCCPICMENIKSRVSSVSRVAESIWDAREVDISNAEGSQKQKQYFVKYKGLAHIHNQWVTETQLLLEAPLLVENFSKNVQMMQWNEAWTLPHQLLAKRLLLSFKPLNESRETAGKVLDYHYEWLVKWQSLDYDQATWESENAFVLDSSEGQSLIKEYENHHGKAPSSPFDKTKELAVKLVTIPAGGPPGMDNIHLSYVKNLHNSWNNGQNSIVFDDQDRAMRIVLFILSLKGVTKPFLLITTSNSLSQWETMFLRVAPCNDFKVSIESSEGQRSVRLLEVQKEDGQLVCQVLLYPVDAFVKDLDVLKTIKWEAVIFDELHRSEISTQFNLITNLSTDKRLFVFCGSLGGSMAEYLDLLKLLGLDDTLLNCIISKTESGDGLGKLKETLSPFMAYECKSESSKFVEFWVPVQISNVQLELYCSTLLSKAMALRSCLKTDTSGALHDILISNRKCCDHPYIVDQSLQSTITKGLEPTKLLDIGIKASGKLQFLDLMLLEMEKRQQRVLILFQPLSGTGKDSTSIGDILDDFVRQRFGENSYERVDGIGIVPSKKQAALNNFNNKDMGRFIFLLEYRACLSTIKLSSVDTVVMFDSDWNPANDLRALQKITIDSRSEQIMIFRLYTSSTLEEKILRLAEQNVTIDSKLQNLSRITSDALLMWGASYLFNKLAEFHSASVQNISSEEYFENALMEEFLNLISDKCSRTTNSIITRAQQCGGTYSKNLPLPSDLMTGLPNGEPPHVFWRKLLEGRNPQWKFVSGSTQRQRKRPQYFEESPRKSSAGNDDVGKKRKKTANNIVEPAVSKPVTEEGQTGGADAGASGVPVHEPQLPSGDIVWSTAVPNEMSFHQFLKLSVSKLCKVFNLSDDVKITVERFLEHVIKNYRVNQEPANTLHAFLISLCWIGSSLLKHKLDRQDSIALAKQHLNFSCKEEEVYSVCTKLELAKETFLHHQGNQKKTDGSKDSVPDSQPTPKQAIDSRALHLARLESKRVKIEIFESPHNHVTDDERTLSENRKLNNDETLQCGKSLPSIYKSRMEDLALKNQKLIRNSEWNEKRVSLEKEYEVEKAVIRALHNNPTTRLEKLKLLEKEFAKKREEHEQRKGVFVKSPKAGQQFAANPDSSTSKDNAHNEPPLQAQDSPKKMTVLPRNPMEAQHSDQAVAPADTLASPNGTVGCGIHSQTTDPDSARGKMVITPSRLLDAMVSTEDIQVQKQDGVPNKLTKHIDSVETDVPTVVCTEEHNEGGTIGLDSSHGVEDQNDFRSSSSSSSTSTAAPQEKAPTVQLLVSPASDHSVPTDPEIQNAYIQLRPHQCSGILDKEVVANPSSLEEAEAEADNLRPIDSSLEPRVEPCPPLSTDPPVSTNQSNIPPEIPSDHTMPESSGEPLNPVAPLVTLETPIQAASGAILSNVQGLENHHQTAAWVPNQSLVTDPLQAELEKLRELKGEVVKSHEDTKMKLKAECEREIAEICLKYEAKNLEADASFQLKKKGLDVNLKRVFMNKVLAEAFRSKCQDLGSAAIVGTQQVAPSGLMQHLHQAPVQPSPMQSPGVAASSPGQSSGGHHVTKQVPPPLQKVHQSAALFSTTPTRPPPPPPNPNPITPSSTPSRPPPNINTITAMSTPSKPPPNISSPITPSAGSLRVGGDIRAPAPHIRPFRASTPPHLASFQRKTPPSQQVSTSLPVAPPTHSLAAALSPLPSSSMQPPPPPLRPPSTPIPPPTSSLLPSPPPPSLPLQSPRPDLDNLQTSASGLLVEVQLKSKFESLGLGKAGRAGGAHVNPMSPDLVCLSDDD